MSKEHTKSERAHTRSLKQEGRLLSKKNWKVLLTIHLQEQGYEGLSSLGEEGLEAVSQWIRMRSKFSSRSISNEQFDEFRREFGTKYDQVLSNGAVGTAIGFITKRTEVTGLTKTTIR